jgi:hypothetical protein
LAKAADALNPFSASSHRLSKHSARDRRDSDSSAGLSSVSLASDTQVSAAAASPFYNAADSFCIAANPFYNAADSFCIAANPFYNAADSFCIAANPFYNAADSFYIAANPFYNAADSFYIAANPFYFLDFVLHTFSSQRKLRSKLLARPGLLMRRKIREEIRNSDAIDEVSDDDGESSTQGFVNPAHLSEIERAMQLAEQGAVSFNDVGGPHFSLQQPIPVDCVYVTPKDIESLSDHFIIFVWDRNFSQIIEFLRLRLLSATHCILLVTEQPLSSTQWFLVGRYVGVKVLLGSCSDTQLLVLAGAERALGIAVFPQRGRASASSNAPVAANAVVDSSSVLIYNMSKKLRQNVNCFIEVADTRSFGFLTRDNSLLNAIGITRSVFNLPLLCMPYNILTGCDRNPLSSNKQERGFASPALPASKPN